MKRKTLNVIQAAIGIVALLILLFSNLATFVEEQHYDSSAHNYVPQSSGVIKFHNIFQGLSIFGIIVVGLFVCYIIMCIVAALNKTKAKDSALHSALPIVNFSLMWIFVQGLGFYNAKGDNLYVSLVFTDISAEPMWYVSLLLMFVIIILGFVKRSKMVVGEIENESAKTINVTQVSASNAEELKKYKELLDSGVITQEEFDAKKKQLLGL